MYTMCWFSVACISLSLLISITSGYQESGSCSVSLVETIPDNLTYPNGSPSFPSTFSAWSWIIDNTKHQINIGSFYWTLLRTDVTNNSAPSSKNGEAILSKLNAGATSNKFKLNIVNSGVEVPNSDLDMLKKSENTNLRWLDMNRFFKRGIVHTKLWTSDGLHAYVGSANNDWRSLRQVKELGVFIQNCSQIVNNLDQIFAAYEFLSKPNPLPLKWPSSYSPKFNLTNPLNMSINGIKTSFSISSSPSQFCPDDRDYDLDMILKTIRASKKFIYIAVMDYVPTVVSYEYRVPSTFWPVIDDALRQAAVDHRIEVRLLISHWKHSSKDIISYLKSLAVLSNITHVDIKVKLFTVPIFTKEQKEIPFARVNHNKYMVTDTTAYIGTSNWSGDYFLYTAGIGFVMKESQGPVARSLRGQAEAIFLRDWNSKYAKNIDPIII